MAVAFDAVGPGATSAQATGATTLSWTHTNVAGAVALTATGVFGDTASAGKTFTAANLDPAGANTNIPTIGGPVDSGANAGGTAAGFVQMWGLANVSSGAHTVKLTASAVPDHCLLGGSVSYTGADLASPFGTAQTTSDSVIRTSHTITHTGSVAGNMVTAGMCDGDNTLVISAGTGRHLNNFDNATRADNIAQGDIAGGGSVTLTWTSTNNDHDALIAVEVQVPSAGGPPARSAKPGKTWRRRFKHQQQRWAYPPPPAGVAAAAPFMQLEWPHRAQLPLPPAGRIEMRAGVYGQTGPPVKPTEGPVRAQQYPPPQGGRIASRAGVFTAPAAAAPIYPRDHPVQAQPYPPPQGGRVSARDGVYSQVGPLVRPPDGPVKAQPEFPRLFGRAESRAGALGRTGPPVRQWDSPVRAPIPAPVRGGRIASRSGILGQAGPPVRQWDGPVRAQRPLPPPGRISRSYGTFTLVIPGAGPPIYPLGHPVAAKPYPPPRGGTADGRTGTFGQTGPPARQWDGPVQARRPLPPPGRIASRSGTFTFVVVGQGPPLYPLGHPVQARQPLPPGGRVIRRAGPVQPVGPPVRPADGPVRAQPPLPPPGRIASRDGVYGQVGPPARQWDGPVGVYRQQPPPPTRGRVASDRGPYGQAGPPVRPLRKPLRAQPQFPRLNGRADWLHGTYTAPPPPPDIIKARITAVIAEPREGVATMTEPREGTSVLTEPREGTSVIAEPREGSSAVTEPREGTSGVS